MSPRDDSYSDACASDLLVYRRELRNNVREVFEMVDEDGGGVRNTAAATL